MIWPRSIVRQPDPIRCPECKSDRPQFTVLDLRSYWYEGEVLKDEITGHRLECQECAHQFSVDRRGTFKHNRRCYAALGEPPAPKPSQQPPEADDDVDPHPIGIPLRRPDA